MPNQAQFDPTTFDHYAALYEELMALPYRQHLELPTLKHLFGDLNGLRVLDFGCGPGVISRWLHHLGAAVTGYDISEGMIEYARQRAEHEQTDIQYQSDLSQLKEQSFDLILAVYVMPYASDLNSLTSMTQSMAQLLKPQGRLISLMMHPAFHTDPNYYRDFGLRLIELSPRQDASPVTLNICHPPHDIEITAYYWSAQTLEQTLKQAGFAHISWPNLQGQDCPVALKPYYDQPHAAIIEAIKAK